jgi:hypothetical protein
LVIANIKVTKKGKNWCHSPLVKFPRKATRGHFFSCFAVSCPLEYHERFRNFCHLGQLRGHTIEDNIPNYETFAVEGEHMNKLLILFLITLPVTASLAQGPSPQDQGREKAFREQAQNGLDTTKTMGWNLKLISGLNLTQVAYKDWTLGGEDALAYTASIFGNAIHLADKTQWSNFVKLAFGQSKLGSQAIRKTDDEIYFESLFIYLLGTHVNPYGAVTLRTQFAPGFAYPDDTTKIQISRFFDPGYMTQSVGLAWQEDPIFATRLGVGVREVITSQFTQHADDLDTPEIEKTRIDGGLESVSSLKWEFAENMLLTSRLELFAPFKTLDQIIVRSDNLIAMKVNQYVTANFNVVLINDVNITSRTQIKQSLSIGLSYTVL